MEQKKFKVFYFSGPGSPIETYKSWRKGEIYSNQFSITYSEQFYQICKELDCQAYVVGLGVKRNIKLKDDNFIVEDLPKLEIFNLNNTLFYFLNEILYSMILLYKILIFKADVLVGTTPIGLFILGYFLNFFKVKVIPVQGCLIVSKNPKKSKMEKLNKIMSSIAFKKYVYATLAHGDDIAEEIEQITDGKNKPIVKFLARYPKNIFEQIESPNFDGGFFNILYIGRIEVNKGIFLLLEIAKQFSQEGKNNIKFHVCGTGSQDQNLQKSLEEAQLQSSFIFHGYCSRLQLLERLSESHIVVVPTLSSFIEGYNQVVLEGVLAGRPVVTSEVCPAIHDVLDAVVKAEIDELESYKSCILKLYEDRDFYEKKRQAALLKQNSMVNSPKIWDNQLKKLLIDIRDQKPGQAP